MLPLKNSLGIPIVLFTLDKGRVKLFELCYATRTPHPSFPSPHKLRRITSTRACQAQNCLVVIKETQLCGP